MKHKNFVLRAAVLILVLSAVILVSGCPTGTGPSSGNNSGGNNPGGALTPPVVSTEETELTALLGKISLDKAIITSATETITISNLPSPAEATAEVISNNTSLIEYEAPNRLKIKKLPETTTDVKITITLKKNSTSKSRDFTVKVFKSGDAPAEEDYLAALTIPTTVSNDFELPNQLQNGTPIVWSTENEDIIKIENSGTNQNAVIAFDIVERKVKLTATANGKTKNFEVTVLPVVKIEINNIYGLNSKKVYEFTQNSITIKVFQDGNPPEGYIYSYTLDGANKKITVTPASILSPEGKWLTIEEYYSLMLEMELNRIKYQLESIDALLSQSNISITDLKEAFKNFYPGDISEYTDQQVFDRFLKDDLGMEYNNFINLPPQEQTNKIKEVLRKLKDEIAQRFGLPSGSSTEYILAEAKKQFQQYAAQQIEELKKPRTYTYSIRKDWGENLIFETNGVYNPSKAWYENVGNWNSHPAPSETSWISDIQAHKTPDGTIRGGLSIEEKQGGNTTSNRYHGTITGSGTSYTFNGRLDSNPAEQITATITDNKNGTIKVKVTSGGSADSTLTFRGHSL